MRFRNGGLSTPSITTSSWLRAPLPWPPNMPGITARTTEPKGPRRTGTRSGTMRSACRSRHPRVSQRRSPEAESEPFEPNIGRADSTARSLEAPPSAARRMPIASISSMKTMQWPPHLRASFLALWPIHCTATTSMPMNVCAKPEPGTAMNGALKPVAMALASIVLPVPGGPMKSSPRSGLPPDCLNWSLACQSSMILRTSSLTSAWPRTWSISTPQLASPGSYDFIWRMAMSTIGTMKIAPMKRLIMRMNSSCARSAAAMPFQKLENVPKRSIAQVTLSAKFAGSPRKMSMKYGMTAKSAK